MPRGPANTLIQDAFLAQARRTPQAPALVSGYGRCSYAELEQISAALAALLAARGVARGARVVLFADRNPALVYGMLGVLRSGAAFQIVDAAYPLPRILACVRQTRPALFVNAGAVVEPDGLHAALGPELADRRMILPANAAEALATLGTPPSDAPPRPGDPADVAYVSFTSGSTGTPKGIVTTHSPLPHFVAWHAAHGGLSAADRFSMLSGLSHDPLLRDVFTPLSIGASLHIPAQATIFDAEALWRWFAREQITIAHLTPAIGEILATGAPQGARLDHLRRLYWGGDVVRPALAAQLARAAPQVAQTSFYGATETPQAMAYFDLAPQAGDGPIPLGRGIAGAQLLVIDDDGQLCWPGQLGEIWIRSPYLSLGYLDDPAQTRARFVPNPFTDVPDDLCYRTGDRGRYLDNGDVVFAGRIDHQLKIRGFRVEPAEIAAALERLPGVQRALVLAREQGGDRQLAAYLVCERGASGLAELRDALRRELPSYLIPRWWTRLASVPLLPSGKIDLQALPAPRDDELGDGVPRAAYVAPSTPTEQRLAAIWGEVLDLQQVGRHDDFFALGGQSLLAVRAIARVRAAFSVALTLRDLFEAPTLERLARELDHRRAADDAPLLPIPAEHRAGALVLSSAQQRLWFLHQLDPDSRAYHLPSAHRLRGPLDVEALRRAFEQLVGRHEALRTVFPATDGVPRQHVLPAGRFELPVDDLTALALPEHEAARRAEQAALARFDLTTGPLLRAHLLRLSADEHVLLLELHHIVADGWSLAVLWRELAALYGAATGGPAPDLPPLPVQYVDHAAWLTGQVIDDQLAYWTRQLAGPPVELALPYRDPRPDVAAAARFRGGRIALALDLELTRRLRALAHHHGATLFMVLSAALRALLARTTGQRDLCIGTVIANRDRSEIEGLIGMFANTLVLRGSVRAGDRFVDLLGRERDLALSAYAHAHAPFERVVDALGLPRSPDRMPLVQVTCVDHGDVTREAALPGPAPVAIEPFHIDLAITPFDLQLETCERAGVRELTVGYNADRLDRAAVAALVDGYQRLLRQIADRPEQPLAQLELLAPADRAAWFDEPARRVRWEPRGPGVIAQIERWMAETPGAPAIVSQGATTDYRALDARSAALAVLLRSRGVGPDRTVAVVAERSAPQIIGMVAALRAGGAYVPINPDLPAERIGWMLDEAAPVVILCDGPPPPALARHAGAVVRLDGPWPPAPDLPAPAVSPDALAYVIYTSGSTGRPKGVMVTRRGFDAQLRWMQDEYPIHARDRVLQLASAMFDFSVVEIFWPLLAGGAILLPHHRGALDPVDLAQLARQHAATVVHFVPSLLRVVLDACHEAPWTTIERVFCGGEALSLDLVRGCQTVFPRAVVHNQYGPTETTINATYWRCHPDDPSVPIGHPVADTTTYVLDDDLAPVPPGGVGQLWIGGVQLARGYLQRAALTAERFRPNPFAARPGERIYQTGDLVRQRADGALDYLGRSDAQLKIRGFRIELGEIEAALHDHPQVRTALVVARDDRTQGKLLVAYVCLSGPATPAELQASLAARLPAYMIPSAFVVLDELPRTATGKIDRKALPVPGGDAFLRAAFVAPVTPTEQRLAEIWREVLGKDQVGIHDSFFALGGHSLLAVRAISRLRTAFSVELPLRCLFEAPTVERLAREVDRRLAEDAARAPAPSVPLVPVSPAERAGALGLSSAQQRLWFLHQLDPESRAYHVPSAHRLRGPLDVEALRRAFEQLIARHEALRTVFPATDGVPRQHVLPAGRFALPVDDLTALAPPELRDRAHEAARRAEHAALARFDLATGPLLRARLLRLAEDDHLLLLDLHHIIADGASSAVLWRELAAVYGALTGGPAASLPPLPVQYLDHAAWLGRWLTGEVLDGQLAYWTQQLADPPGELPLPYRAVRSPGATASSFRGSWIDLGLDAELTRRLRALAHHHGATLFMVLSAALRALLARTTGQRDLCIGTVIANRDRSELEGLIGMFASTVVLRGSVHAGDRFVDVLARERHLMLSAHAHAHAPFERVVDALGLPRSPDRMPLVQVMCIDQGDVTEQATLPGLHTEPFRIDLQLTPFELTFDTRERAGVRELTVSYNADLFDRETVAALVARYERLLIGIADRPERPLSQLELLTPAERAARFDEPARRVTWEPRGPSAIAQIERWMAETPGAPALLGQGTEVSYHELDARSAALAALLRHRGVAPDRTVAVVAERSAPQIIAFVAVLRAGGAYVPIKPDLPGERIGWMLDETAPVAILCDGPPPPALARHAPLVVRLDQPWPPAPADPPVPTVPPDALAYVIYTSGSTGRPKGVMVTRRGFDAQLRWFRNEYPIGARDRVLQLTSAMFDISVVEIFPPLMAGGVLVLPRLRGEMDPAYLAALVARHVVTAVHCVPSLLRVIVDACQDTPWTTVEQLFCCGEVLPLDLVRACRPVFPRAVVHNQYGPTETTVIATSWQCHPDHDAAPIGSPVADTTVYVLDDDLAPVPPGGVGQLWIGGVQLARGYLARPALTAERFRPNPFAARPGERIYQTGDLVRQRADGVLDFLGRSDAQLKIRGFRIELGEIEAVLHDHPQVRTALVVARDSAQGKLLVAYVCLSGPATPAELQAALATRLPAYMIPSAFVVLDELPRTATGKIDRKALPAPDDASQRAAYVAPTTPTEQRLAAIWREVLGKDPVGIHDSFFALGGHSLLVVRLVAQIGHALGIELSPRSVFERPTIAGQAERILAQAQRAGTRSDDRAECALVEQVAALPDAEVAAQLAAWSSVMLEVQPAPSTSALPGARRALADRLIAQHRIDTRPSQPLARRTSPIAPATFAQQLQWDYHQRGNFPTLGIHATALAIHGPLDARAMQQAVADLVERQAALRTTFCVDQGRLRQTVQARGPALDVVDLSRVPASVPTADRASRARRLFEAISRPHDLTREVFRAQLVHLDDHEHLLLLAPHHIVLDGFSWGVLLADLATLYRAAAAGTAPELPPLALPYGDFCFWQRTLEDRPLGRAQLAFWHHAVAGYPGLELPGDRSAAPRGSVGMATDTYEAGVVPFVLDGPRWQAALHLCARLGCTPYVVIASGFLLLLTRWSGRDDVCALSSNFHRNRPGSEAVIGNFVTPYPLRVAFDARATLEAAVRHCHDAVLAHREHGQVAPSSALAAWPEWTRYNLNYQLDVRDAGTLDVGAVTVEPLDWSAYARRTPHDLALFVRQDVRGVRGDLVYNAERFSPALAARAAARLDQLIDTIATAPSHLVGALSRLP